jgi:phytoene/squalene synthetase
MMALGQEFGLALQTVNVVRGIPADIGRGWFFVPRDFLPDTMREGRAFLEPSHREEAVRVIDRLLEKATGHFRAAQRYIELLPRFKGQLRYFCLLPYFFGVRTLALSRENPDVLVSEVKLARDEVRAIAGKSKLRGWSNAWIRRYARVLQKSPRT